MDVVYEKKKEMTLIGYYTHIAPEEGAVKCPLFWEEEYAKKYGHLFAGEKPKTPVEEAVVANQIGMYAICEDGEEGFRYWIAGEYMGGEVPEGLSLFTFPESEWAVFWNQGPLPESLQSLNERIWTEWAPFIEKKYAGNGKATLEVYSAGNPEAEDYEVGIWVPIREKKDIRICQSCGMPMESMEVYGTEKDGTINSDYCRYCYMDGEFVDKVTMEEYIEKCSQYGAQAGMTNEEMKEYCTKLFPTLKRWK